MKKISIIGTGYVGLISGVCFAEIGHKVICVDVDKNKVEKINKKTAPIYEKGLDELLDKHVGENLFSTTDLHSAVLETDYTFIAVGTPYEDDYIDLSYIKNATKQIALAIKEKKEFHTVIVKSTVVPNTTIEVVKPIIEKFSGKKLNLDFGLAMNPEFLREGVAINDFMNPDRIVIGGCSEHTSKMVKSLYDFYFKNDYLLTDPTTAEMIKYTSNSLFATSISFANEISNLCLEIGVDNTEVEKGVHLDSRISPIINGKRVYPALTGYLQAGAGFGGSCFPKDVKALAAFGDYKNIKMHLLKSVIEVNKNQPKKIISIINNKIPEVSNKKNILILGAAFKEGTDDIRESPSVEVIKELLSLDFKISVYDPIASKNIQSKFGSDISIIKSLKKSIKNIDIIILMTMFEDFKDLPRLIESENPNVYFIDGRRKIDKHSIKNYFGIGLGNT